MPKSDFNEKKPKKIKLAQNMSMKERDKIKDVKARLEVAKLQAQAKGKTITAEQLEKEKQAKNAPVKGVTVKVRPKVSTPQNTGSTQQTDVTQGTKTNGSTQKSRSYAEREHQKAKLEHYREQLATLVNTANTRVQDLANTDFTSRALDTARQSLPESRDSNGELFTANLRTEKQIKRELSRVMTFLNDPTSLSTGAERFTEDLTAAGLFGGQYRANGGPGYNTDEVSQEVGEQVFDLYGRVLAQEGGWERVMGYFKANSGGLIEYGSENLINAIYEMTVQLGTSDSAQEEIINRAVAMIDDMINSYQEMATKQRAGVDYGLIGFDETAEDRRHHWQWNMERRGLL